MIKSHKEHILNIIKNAGDGGITYDQIWHLIIPFGLSKTVILSILTQLRNEGSVRVEYEGKKRKYIIQQ